MEAAGARTAVVGVAAEDGARENLHTFRFRCDVRAFGCLMSEVEHVGSGWCMFLAAQRNEVEHGETHQHFSRV